MTYVCKQLQQGICQEWIENASILDKLAITPNQALQIAFAMILCFLTAFFIGEIGHMIKVNSERRF